MLVCVNVVCYLSLGYFIIQQYAFANFKHAVIYAAFYW